MKNKQYMKLYRILAILIVILIGVAGCKSYPLYDRQNSGNSFLLPEEDNSVSYEPDGKDSMEQEEMLVEKKQINDSLVRIRNGSAGASGLIWKVTEEEIIIVTNKHVLQEGDRLEVGPDSNSMLEALYLGVSTEYDVGFCSIRLQENMTHVSEDGEELSPEKKEFLTRVSENKAKYEVQLCKDEEEWKQETYLGLNVLHAGMDIREDKGIQMHEGYVSGYEFIPEFYEKMLITTGYSEGGMSGGGVFSMDGKLLGLLSGGEISEGQESKETYTTYSIPTEDLNRAYEEVLSILNNS